MARKPKKDKPPRLRNRKRDMGDFPSALDMIEEAIHLLRRLPMSAWAAYLVGTGPFMIAFLYFWNDMSYSGLAAEHLLPDSLTLVILFVWMRFWQVCFARGMWATLRNQPLPPIPAKMNGRILMLQLQWQTTALFAFPILLLITIPFARGYGFFQNMLMLSAICDEESSETITARAYRLAGVWTTQAWTLLLLFFFLWFMLFWLWVLVIYCIPFLLKVFLGADGAAIRSGDLLTMNSTTESIAFGLTYICYDLVAKAAFLLRCFYAESRQSGDDLLFSLHTIERAARKVGRMATVAVLWLAAGFACCQPLMAENPPDTQSMDNAIDETMSDPDYIWRFPKEEVAGDMEPPDWVVQLENWIEAWQDRIADWLEGLFDDNEDPQPSGDFDMPHLDLSWMDGLIYLMIFIAVAAIVIVLIRIWRGRIPTPVANADLSAIERMPDLTREDIAADELPRNRWLEIAQELIGQGNYRLALRALFLAELSFLAEEGMIQLARYKSNLDYRRELMRRGDSSGVVLEAYVQSARLFDGVWYGERAVGQPEIENMQGYLRSAGMVW